MTYKWMILSQPLVCSCPTNKGYTCWTWLVYISCKDDCFTYIIWHHCICPLHESDQAFLCKITSCIQR